MKPAKDYAQLSARIGQLASELKPLDSDPCASALNLAVFHLRSAAFRLREVAEFQAARGKPGVKSK